MTSSYWFQGEGAPGPDVGDPIGQSLRFRGDQSLHTTFSGSSNTFTISFWTKISTADADLGYLFSGGVTIPVC